MQIKLLSIVLPKTNKSLYKILTDIRELNYLRILSLIIEGHSNSQGNEKTKSIEKELMQSIVFIKDIINTKLDKNDKINFSKQYITGLVEIILNKEITDSFYHSGPVIILDLEKDQLIRRINLNQTITRNIKSEIGEFTCPEVYRYLVSNIFIKYFLPKETPIY